MISIEELTVEIARQRDVLKRIEALVWYEPEDDADLVEAVRAMARERDEARRDLGAILAVIHRDGGHHTGEHGLSQSVADAHATWASVVRERDEAEAEIERLQDERNEAQDEIDRMRAEVERLRAALEETEHAMHLRIRAGYDKTIADAWRAKVAEVEEQRNANAREIDTLRAERRQLRHRVVECLRWVGRTPYPNTPGFDEMIAVRDLAADTLEEVKP